LIIGVPKETFPGERRVALVPAIVPSLTKAGLEVAIESGAGSGAGHPDEEYTEKGAKIAASRAELFASADVILQVRTYGANPSEGRADVPLIRRGQTIIGLADPLTAAQPTKEIAAAGADLFAMELMPRITRAQSMDVLSSMATVLGYKAVILAADRLSRMFPMLMTAAGTITPARVLVIGAGVAGLQAIASAKRLGAVVHGYDVRPAVKEQVMSLGAKFVELPIEASHAEDAAGYARAQDDSFYNRQRELMTRVVAECDVVITTAAVPGKRAPVLITAEMVAGMPKGSIIVDLAAERGGNCALTKPDEEVVSNGVTILGPINLASTLPRDASQLYSRNLANFLLHLVKDGALKLEREDEIVRETLVTHGGEIVHPQAAEALRLLAATAGPRKESY
jgi:NAD(P) transhydrogenase subunit alpha